MAGVVEMKWKLCKPVRGFFKRRKRYYVGSVAFRKTLDHVFRKRWIGKGAPSSLAAEDTRHHFICVL